MLTSSIQTPLPVIFGVHLKQTVSLFLFILPFTLVDLLKWKMVFIVTACAFTMMGVEHIAAQVEQPFGTYVLHHDQADDQGRV